MANAINWFEIPAADFDRACTFYSTILGTELVRQEMGNMSMGFLPADQTGVGGAVTHAAGMEPGQNGSVVYLNGGNDLNSVLEKVEQAGGSVVVPKTEIGNNFGFFGIFIDSEGNKVGVHSMN